MKNLKLILAIVVLCGFWSCQRTELEELSPQSPYSPALSTGNLPNYSELEVVDLINSTDDEEKFVAKMELLTYAVTRFIGEHGGLGDNSDLRVTIPCDLGLNDPDDFLRVLADAGGMAEDAAEAILSDYIVDCGSGCSYLPTGYENYFEAVVDNLNYRGTDYDLFSAYEESESYTTQDLIFISYGVRWDGTEYRAVGFQYDLAAADITREELPVDDAVDLDAMLLDLWQLGVARYNDPCYYVNGGGSGGSGGSGGGSGLDDDGSFKNGFSGPLVDPFPGFSNTICSGATGLRITEFHLARDNESGLFSGNVEVYLNASFYDDADTYNTLVTNLNSTKYDGLEYAGISYNIKRGKQLAELPKTNVSSSSYTNSIIGVGDGFTPTSSDWVIIDEGFCDATNGGGFSHVYITTFERDPIIWGGGFWFYDTEMSANGPWAKRQSLYMPFLSDRWVAITLEPSDFGSSNSIYLVDPGSGASYTSTTQPAANTSWFLIEKF